MHGPCRPTEWWRRGPEAWPHWPLPSTVGPSVRPTAGRPQVTPRFFFRSNKGESGKPGGSRSGSSGGASRKRRGVWRSWREGGKKRKRGGGQRRRRGEWNGSR